MAFRPQAAGFKNVRLKGGNAISWGHGLRRAPQIKVNSMQNGQTLSRRIADSLERRSGLFILAVIAISGLLAIPMVTMAPEETASDNPGGLVYDLQDMFNTNLPPRFHGTFFIAEAKGSDILTQAPLWELLQNTERLRQVDREGKLTPEGMPEQAYLVQWLRCRPPAACCRHLYAG